MTDINDVTADPAMRPAPSDADMAKAMSVMSASVPTMPPTPQLDVTLPVSGATARVRELTGKDEEDIAGFDMSKHVTSELITNIVEACTTSLVITEDGGERDMRKQIGAMLVGERDFLFLAALRATYGDIREFQVKCKGCGELNDVGVNLADDFPWIGSTVDHTIEIDLVNGTKAKFMYPTADVQKSVQTRTRRIDNDATVNTISIGATLLTVGNERLAMNTEEWARQLGVADRRKIIRALADAPGPRMEEVRVACASCEMEIIIGMDWSLLLFA